MSNFVNNVYVSGYNAGKAYDRYDLAVVTSGHYPKYFVSVSDVNLGTLDTTDFLSNDFWKRLDDNSYRFTEVWTPTYQTSMALDIKNRASSFGDGYVQSTDTSLFGSRLSYDVSFKNIDSKELKSLLAFFEVKAGSDYFYMDLNPFITGRKVIGKNWKHTYNSDNLNDFSVNVFEALTDI